METVVIQVFNGLSVGSILLLIALGLAFTFGLMGIINMAHGELIMVGAYAAYVTQGAFSAVMSVPVAQIPGFYFGVAIVVAFLAAAAVGLALEAGLIRFLYGRPLDSLLATWGVGLVLQQVARSIFGAPNVQVVSPSWLNGALTLAPGVLLPYKRLFILATVAAAVLGLYLLLYRSAQGRRIRAAMQNRDIASALGVSTRSIDRFTFALGSGLAGVAGCTLTLIGPIGPTLGTNYIVDAFLVVILGGLGQLVGTVAAAFSIGSLNTTFELFSTATVGKVAVFLLVIVFLQFRPNGFVTVKGRR
jgi:urea transport system permease protein